LDYSFVDSNDVENMDDDEIGSFVFGWGLYIYRLTADYPQAVVQVVHPNDDYIAPYMAIDLFETLNAGQLFFASAGREARWTESGAYNNSKSLSDPSRNARHVFQVAHEATVDYYIDEFPDIHPLTFQIHSYDTRNRDFSSMIITPGYLDRRFNPPLYDWSGVLGGMIDRTPWTVHPAGIIGNREPIVATEFYASSSTPRLIVYDEEEGAHQIPDPNDLYGYSGNLQLLYRDELIDRCSDDEWLMHVELDELPNSIEDSSEAEFYGGAGFPLRWANFQTIVDYYHPAAAHLLDALDTLALYVDTEAPAAPTAVQLRGASQNTITVAWIRGGDPNFYTYRAYYDTSPEVDEFSPYLDRTNIGSLCAQSTDSVRIRNLLYDQDYYIRISAVDLNGLETELTEAVMGRTENTPRVLIPNGGELWDYSAQNLIQWAGVGYEQGVWIEINRNYPFGQWELLVENTIDDGEAMVVAEGPLTDRARIRVRDETSSASDISNLNFSVLSWQGYLEVERVSTPQPPLSMWDVGMIECPQIANEVFRFRNSGLQPVTIATTTLLTGIGFQTVSFCPEVFVIPPESADPCSVEITFSSLEVGEHFDTLSISTDASNGNGAVFLLPLRAERIRTIPAPQVVLTVEGSDMRLAWNPVTESLLGCEIQTAYQIWYCQVPGGSQSFLGFTTDTTMVHASILFEESKIFYVMQTELVE
jgi:hypothetical protein